MKRIPEQEIRKALRDLPPEDVETVVALVNSLCQKRAVKPDLKEAELSETEHAPVLGVLDSVTALSITEIWSRSGEYELFTVPFQGHCGMVTKTPFISRSRRAGSRIV
jgi:hypothetical protein